MARTIAALRARVGEAADRLRIPFGFASGSSDHFSYIRRRVPAMMIAWTDLGPIHTPRDRVELIETWRLRAAGLVATQTALALVATE